MGAGQPRSPVRLSEQRLRPFLILKPDPSQDVGHIAFIRLVSPTKFFHIQTDANIEQNISNVQNSDEFHFVLSCLGPLKIHEYNCTKT